MAHNYNRSDYILDLIENEFIDATRKFGEFHNAHEGYAVLLEEVDELWEVIKLKQTNQDRIKKITIEAIHVGAMAMRLLYDCCKDEINEITTEKEK